MLAVPVGICTGDGVGSMPAGLRIGEGVDMRPSSRRACDRERLRGRDRVP